MPTTSHRGKPPGGSGGGHTRIHDLEDFRRRFPEFLNHAYGIPGLDEAASEKLLSDLIDVACRPPRMYAHRWHPGDMVIWDDRCVLHRARPYDYREVGVMRHTRVAGDPATELAPTRRDERASAYDLSSSNR